MTDPLAASRGPKPLRLSVRQAADYLGVSPWTVRGFLRQGRLPYYRVGRRIVLRRRDLREFLVRCRVTPTPSTEGPRDDD